MREYRPGTDVVAEETQHEATSKTLALGHGLSLSTDVYREPALKGFGLVLVKDDFALLQLGMVRPRKQRRISASCSAAAR